MNAPARTALMDVAIEDIEYQRIGGEPLLARLYRPKGRVGGAGPFPAVVLGHPSGGQKLCVPGGD